MARKAVYSSFVAALDHDEESGTLTVEYQNGKSSTHALDDSAIAAIWNAPSIGTALHAHIPGFTSKGKRDADAG